MREDASWRVLRERASRPAGALDRTGSNPSRPVSARGRAYARAAAQTATRIDGGRIRQM